MNSAVPVVKVGVLKFDTVNWELKSMQHHGPDQACGFTPCLNRLCTDYSKLSVLRLLTQYLNFHESAFEIISIDDVMLHT